MSRRSKVYDTYWQFAAERQKIFFKKLRGEVPPYTDDPILATYKFCNVYRAADRVSQFLIKDVIYKNDLPAEDTLLRIFFFRLLNKIETWQKLEQEFGLLARKNFPTKAISRFLINLRKQGEAIYGNAFILSASKSFGHSHKHDNHLALVETVFRQRGAGFLIDSPSLERLYRRLDELPLIGQFMAYQLATDFNYSEVFNFDENDFTVAGPGAVRGIGKCFDSPAPSDYAKVIMEMVENQDREFVRLGLDFQRLGGRKLHAIDCQGLFCEVDKYTRVKFPELKTNRTRIKAKYQPTSGRIDYFFPPKWRIKTLL